MSFRIPAQVCYFYIICLTFLHSALAVDPATICPPSEIIEPCLCYKDCKECFSNIFCEDITDQDVLSRVLDESSDYQYVTFTLKQASLMHIPDSLFDVRGLHHLTVMESSMVSLFSRTPTTSPHISYMFLDKVQMHLGMQWELLSGFSNLKRLILFHSFVRRIGQSFVDNAPKSLEELKMNNCSTTRIEDGAFASLPNLLEVYVTWGKIKDLKRSMFPKPSKLKVFSFSGNRLSSLPEDIFSEMPDLKYIYLEGNFLKEMPENIFGPVFPNLLVFHFDDNPLKCRCNIRWITVTNKKLQQKDFLGNCQDPKNLHLRPIRDLVPEDFLHCASCTVLLKRETA